MQCGGLKRTGPEVMLGERELDVGYLGPGLHDDSPEVV